MLVLATALLELVIDLGLQPGSYRLAVGVRHPLDDILSFARIQATVP